MSAHHVELEANTPERLRMSENFQPLPETLDDDPRRFDAETYPQYYRFLNIENYETFKDEFLIIPDRFNIDFINYISEFLINSWGTSHEVGFYYLKKQILKNKFDKEKALKIFLNRVYGYKEIIFNHIKETPERLGRFRAYVLRYRFFLNPQERRLIAINIYNYFMKKLRQNFLYYLNPLI